MKRNPTKLVQSVRECAAFGLTLVQAATKLDVTQGVVVGIAYRNEITFTNTRGPDIRPRPPRTVLPASRVPLTQYRRPKLAKPPDPWCAWGGCGCEAVAGGLFCTEHRRRAVL